MSLDWHCSMAFRLAASIVGPALVLNRVLPTTIATHPLPYDISTSQFMPPFEWQLFIAAFSAASRLTSLKDDPGVKGDRSAAIAP
jgi:hypothetical protein